MSDITIGLNEQPVDWIDRDDEDDGDGAALSDDGGGGYFRCLGEGVTDQELAHAPEWDRPLLEMHRGITNPDSDPNRALVDFSASGTPEFVLERIREAIDGGAIFSDIDDVPSSEIMAFRETFKENLGTDNFTLDSVTEAVMSFTDKTRDSAEMTARTEMSSVLNTAREDGYQERGETEEGLFYWTGAEPGDDRQTEACRLLIERTNPFHGGEPVPLEELRSLLTWAAEEGEDTDPSMVREGNWLIHIGERSTFSKAPPNWQQL